MAIIGGRDKGRQLQQGFGDDGVDDGVLNGIPRDFHIGHRANAVERQLGNDPKTGKPVAVKIGRYGPLVQLGSTDDVEKPRFASLQKGQSVATLTLDEALKLFDLPRTLGELDGETV